MYPKWLWLKTKQLGQTAGFSLPFHLPEFHRGPLFLSHTQIGTRDVRGLLREKPTRQGQFNWGSCLHRLFRNGSPLSCRFRE